MRRWSLVILTALLASLAAGTASAQNDYLNRFAFGVGLGLVDLSDSIDSESTETYLTASFRILLGDKDKQRDDQTVVAYIEPEIGYWEGDDRFPLPGSGPVVTSSQSDLMVGINLIGIVPFNRVDYFLGAGLGLHFFDTGLDPSGIALDSDETFGVNIQTGIDFHIGESIDVFGLLRLDLVEDIQEEQAKIVLGLRFNFG